MSGALTFGGRLSGFAALVASLISFVAALAVLDYWRWKNIRFSGVVVLIGALAVLIANLGLMALQLEEHELTAYLAIWIGMVAWAAWALWLLLHRKKVWRDIRACTLMGCRLCGRFCAIGYPASGRSLATDASKKAQIYRHVAGDA
ncbi:hypothetical protein [Streptomyces sp. FH025]|uniref:hypothetical protein n=1 Tax=Streptomyces sp. FH025 TaxID=2815937 RepID=UPI001A9D94D6|nr:hypothetical protein [Streptomyces sp. FH025]MBO1414924.1 hypothetical protein [Streptomyces sp. FH025]